MPSALDSTFRNERVLKVDSSIFHHSAVSDSLQGEIYDKPTVQAIKKRARELSNATDRQADGRIWAKYSWCPYEQESKVHGVTGDGVGLWVIIPNDESGYNLPSNHPGSINDDGDGGAAIVIITHQEGVPHNIGSEQWANRGPEPWEKLYGPVLLYVNSGASHAELWADAKRRAEVEASAHPAAWMQNELYPLERGSIRGRVLTAEGKPAAGAWVILCHPNPNPAYAWQRHIGPYIYRTFAAFDGTFEIKGVRPDSYSLFARIDGSLGLARTDGITLNANQQRDAGVLTIEEKPHGKLLWEIGSPDGTPREFLARSTHTNSAAGRITTVASSPTTWTSPSAKAIRRTTGIIASQADGPTATAPRPSPRHGASTSTSPRCRRKARRSRYALPPRAGRTFHPVQ